METEAVGAVDVISKLRSEAESYKTNYLEALRKAESLESEITEVKRAQRQAEQRYQQCLAENNRLDSKLDGVVECFEKLLEVVKS